MSTELSPHEAQALDVCAHFVSARGLTTPVLLLLGATRPLAGVVDAGLGLVFSCLDAFAPTATVHTLRELVERPNGAQRFCDLLRDRLDVLDRA